jgi:hypothetical protein
VCVGGCVCFVSRAFSCGIRKGKVLSTLGAPGSS